MKNKTALLLFAGATVVLFLLAIGLTNLQMAPGRPFSLGTLDPAVPPGGSGGSSLNGDAILLVIRGIMIIGAMGIPILLIYAIVSPEGRRQLIAGIMMIVLVLAACAIFSSITQQQGTREVEKQSIAATEKPPEQATSEPTDVFEASTPEWMVVAASVAVATLLSGILLGVAYMLWRRAHPAPGVPDALAEQAQGALDALRSGVDLKETVLRCYHEMSQAVRQERGLQRDADMTPREFEQALQARGMPGEAVRTLTRLFEQARYGHQRLDHAAEQQAIESLDAILVACRAGRTS